MEKRLGYFLVLIALCGGCSSTSIKTSVGSDGIPIHHVECTGTGLTWGDCFQAAGKICPRGYATMERHEGRRTTAWNPKESERWMVVRCYDGGR